MVRFVRLNYWPSALLSLALLIGLYACFKRLNCVEMSEVKALISILFGFSTTCLLLGFVWLIQWKPFKTRWQNHLLNSMAELPSMHPHGRVPPLDRQSTDMTIDTISSTLTIDDDPPGYNEALINSRPVRRVLKKEFCDCKRKSQDLLDCRGRVCRVCLNALPSNNQKQVAVDIARSFSIELEQQQTSVTSGSSRKISFHQLDAGQLALISSSPPKYHQLYIHCKDYHKDHSS